jgi:hypothetical protein
MLLLCWLGLASVQACPGCKEPVGTRDNNPDGVSEGFSYSVLFMLAVPTILLTGLGTVVVRTVQRVDREQALRLNQS